MIKNIKLTDFQSHKESELEFDKGVNVICGPSDSGKTSIIRALRWVKENRPLGKSIIRDGKKKCSVNIDVINGKKITSLKHTRDGKGSKYIIDDDIIYEALGSTIPEEVNAALNLNPENTHYQMELPFLVTDSPGMVATSINEVTLLEKAESVSKKLESKRRENKSKLDNITEQINSIKVDLNQPVLICIKRLRKIVDKRREALTDEVLLDSKSTMLESIIEEYDETKYLLGIQERSIINSVEGLNLGNTLKALYIELEALKSNKKGIEEVVMDHNAAFLLLKTIKKESKNSSKVIETGTKIKKLHNNVNEIVEEVEDIKKIILTHTFQKKLQQTIIDELIDCQVSMNKLLPQLKNCPLCGVTITTNTQLDRILHEKTKN